MDTHRFAQSLHGGQWLQIVIMKPESDLGRATNLEYWSLKLSAHIGAHCDFFERVIVSAKANSKADNTWRVSQEYLRLLP